MNIGTRGRRRKGAVTGLICVLGALAIAACGDDGSGDATSAAFDASAGLEPVVACLTDEGWTEVGSISSGSAYSLAAESGTSVLLSVKEPEEPLLDETFTVAASDPADESLGVETVSGTISEDERGQIEACAGG